MNIICVVPCKDAGRFLGESIESLARQTLQPSKIILIEDGSQNSETLSEIQRLSRIPRLLIVKNTTNLGKAASINNIFDSVTADYVIIQDADDRAHPNRIERQVAFMESHKSLGCSSSFVNYINTVGKTIGRGMLDLLSIERLHSYLDGDDPFGLFCPAVILRGEVIKNAKMRFRGEYWPADDIDLWNRIAEAGWQVLAQPEFLVDYRIHGASAVTSNFYRTRLKYEYVRESLRLRRSGFPEPTWPEFELLWNQMSFLKKLNRNRKIFAKGLYRGAGFDVAEKELIMGALRLSVAACLQPSYVFPRLFRQALRKHDD